VPVYYVLMKHPEQEPYQVYLTEDDVASEEAARQWGQDHEVGDWTFMDVLPWSVQHISRKAFQTMQDNEKCM